jgi:biotin operon repressor
MGDEALTPAHKFEYRFLKQQVDNLEQERYRYDARPNIERELYQARNELKEFVRKLRTNGIQI